MSQYARNNPEEPVNHDWYAGGTRSSVDPLPMELVDQIRRLERDKAALLEACKRSLSWLTSYPGDGSQDAYNQMRAAIAQAEQAEAKP